MPYESPAAILFDVNGIPMSVSGGVVVPVSTSALLVAGITSAGTASYLKAEPDGTLWVTGSFSTVPAGVTTVTGTVALQGLANVSGALPVFISASNLLTVTGSVGITNFPVTQSVTGSVGISGISTITGSITVPNTVTVTGSVSVLNTVNVTGTLGANQGNAGTIAQSWFTRITDGTQVLGTGSSAPLFVEEAVHTGSSISAVARTTSAVALVALASQTRRGVTIYNDSPANLFVLYGSGTVNQTNNFSIRVGAQGYLELPANFTGPVYGVWQSAGAGNALVTQFFT